MDIFYGKFILGFFTCWLGGYLNIRILEASKKKEDNKKDYKKLLSSN